MSEVASAYVTLLPSAKGFGKRTESIMNGELGGTGERQGKSIGSRMASGMGKTLKVGALGVAAAAGGILATGLVKGFGRLQGIEQAEAKLTGLGHSAKGVEKIMENATSAVTGTAFGLDAAATVAASAVAAGIKPGADLERNLKLVGDAATIAGTDMGSMGAIFNKVAASNKLQMDSVNQLHDAGIPALALVAKQLGVTAEEASKMASEGKVDFATFQAAMEKGMGGAALESGKTFAGSMANMQAALGRLGARVLDGVFSQMPGLFTAAGSSLDKLAPVADKVGAALGKGMALAGKAVKDLIVRFREFASGSGGQALAQIAVTARAQLLPALQKLRTALGPMLTAFGKVASSIGAALLPILKQVGTLVMGTVIPMLLSLYTYLIGKLAPVFTQVAGIISGTVVPILSTIAGFLVGTLIPAVMGVAESVGSSLKPVFDALVSAIQAHVLPAVQKLLGRFQTWLPTIQKVIMFVVRLVGGILKFAAAILGKVLPPVIKFAGWLIGKLASAIGAVIGWVVKIIGWIVKFGGGLIDAGKKVGKFAGTVATKIGEVVGWFRDLPGKIKAAFSGAKTWLLDAGKKILDGLIDGLTAGFDKVKNKLGELTGKIPDWKGPAKKDKKLLTPTGQMIMDGLVGGIKSREKQLKAALGKVTKQIESFKGIRDAVRSAFAPDLFSGSLSEFLSGLSSQRATNDAVKAAVRGLSKVQGISKSFMAQLMQSGNADVILGLAGASRSTLMRAQSDWLAVQSTAADIGRISATAATGESMKSLVAEQKRTNKLLSQLDKKIAKGVGKEVNGAARKGRGNRK